MSTCDSFPMLSGDSTYTLINLDGIWSLDYESLLLSYIIGNDDIDAKTGGAQEARALAVGKDCHVNWPARSWQTVAWCSDVAGWAALAAPNRSKNPVADQLCVYQVTDTGNMLSSADINHIFIHKCIGRTSSQSIGTFPECLHQLSVGLELLLRPVSWSPSSDQ